MWRLLCHSLLLLLLLLLLWLLLRLLLCQWGALLVMLHAPQHLGQGTGQDRWGEGG